MDWCMDWCVWTGVCGLVYVDWCMDCGVCGLVYGLAYVDWYMDWCMWTEFRCLRMGTEVGSCEQGNGPLGLKRAENILNKNFASRS